MCTDAYRAALIRALPPPAGPPPAGPPHAGPPSIGPSPAGPVAESDWPAPPGPEVRVVPAQLAAQH